MSHSFKSEFSQHFDRHYLARPRRRICFALIALLALQGLMVAVIVSSESTRLDRKRLLVEECPPGAQFSTNYSNKQSVACQRLPVRFDTKV